MLTLDGVHKRYGDVAALDGVSMSLGPGELFALLGPNGAGKSTLVRLAVGLTSPDGGRVAIGRHGSPRLASARAHIGIAPQELALYDNLTGEENLRFFAQLYGLSRARAFDRIEWALELTGLTARRADALAGYSGGMKRRLNVAAALLHDPKLLILDEPTAGVDPQARAAMLELIVTLRDAGKTILYTTHYIEEVADRCDRVAILDRGRLLALDTVRDLVERHGGPPSLRARVDGELRTCPARDAADALDRLDAWRREGRVDAFSLHRPGLAEVFLELTGRSWRD